MGFTPREIDTECKFARGLRFIWHDPSLSLPGDSAVAYRRTHERMLQDIAAKQMPALRARSNARVVKRKMSNFKLKRAEHYRPPTPHGRLPMPAGAAATDA